MTLCTAHHPVYSTCLCEKQKFHTGEHTTLYREKGAKYSHRFNWPQTQEEFLNTLADNTAELDQLEAQE